MRTGAADEALDALYAQRLRLARHARGMSQADLAERSGVPQSTISKYEKGLMEPSSSNHAAIAAALDYPQSFFASQRHDRRGFATACLFPRKRQRLGVRVLNQLQAKMNILSEHAAELLDSVEAEHDFVFPRIGVEHPEQEEEVADGVRKAWRLPATGPIPNLVREVENAGGIVYRFDFGTDDLDAVSVWPDGMPPVFFLNARMSSDRCRWSLAHEIGHMVMHRVPSETQEEEANRFASALLMPASDAERVFSRGVNIRMLAEQKLVWLMSMAAMIQRAFQLEVITAEKRKSLFVQMSRYGYRRREPVTLRHEEIRTIPNLIRLHMEELDYSVPELAALLNLTTREFREIYLDERRGLRVVK